MFELTNEQRICLGLTEVKPQWTLMKLRPSPNDNYDTYIYVNDNNQVKKVIWDGIDCYKEDAVDAQLSEDRTMLLPKTSKGKAKQLSAATINNHVNPVGTYFLYLNNRGPGIGNYDSQRCFYHPLYACEAVYSKEALSLWLDRWCKETGSDEMADMQAFSQTGRTHVKYKEGDFFRIRLNRHLFGYGRIIINYHEMRRKKIPFYDIFMGKPVLAGLYHIATEDKQVPLESLEALPMIPPNVMMDNVFFYGEAEIIGHKPIDEETLDLPIYCGCYGDKDGGYSFEYSRGRRLIKKENVSETLREIVQPLGKRGVGFNFDITLPLLQECIAAGNNQPYWNGGAPMWVRDWRNPIYAERKQQLMKMIDPMSLEQRV